MLGLGLRFNAGRFHATPWGRHVNEGAPEWPPSPWRLLRALVATWKRKLDGHLECPSETVERLLRAMSEPPSFALPPATMGHTRHYMPWYKKGPDDKTLVFDAFIAIRKSDEVVVLWPDVTLEGSERVALERIAENLGYLGRAESWAEGRLLTDDELAEAETRINCVPSNAELAKHGTESVRVLCVDSESAFANEHTPMLETTEGKGRSKERICTPIYDPDWHLCLETLELHDKGWSDTPGARWVSYLRRRDCFAVSPSRRVIQRERPRPTVARFAIDATVLPLVEETLCIAEKARVTAMGCYRRIEERKSDAVESSLPRSVVFSGKDEQGPLSGHAHAFYLPTDEDDDGRLDHLTIIADMGFGASEQKALDRMTKLKRDQGDPLQLILMALGQREAIAAQKMFGPSRVWISATPFLATRFPKSNGRKRDPQSLLGPGNQDAFVLRVLSEELARLRERRPEIPEPVTISAIQGNVCGAHNLRPIQFKRFRQKRSDDGGRRAAGVFRIEFAGPVTGPICLGHSSHFGLGLFVPAVETGRK